MKGKPAGTVVASRFPRVIEATRGYLKSHQLRVYANTDVFLRELISNGADACEKLRTMALDDASLELGDVVDRLPDCYDGQHVRCACQFAAREVPPRLRRVVGGEIVARQPTRQ